MYLMNVPPVVASHTEWRTCGPLGGYSLPIGFNDSDTDLSNRGSPISNKVQMIIESLRSTQSSPEMSDEIEGNVLPDQACKGDEGSVDGGQSNAVSTAINQTCAPFLVKNESTDSDSDDSVDKGIEEAIKEYLKEKDGHKRKVEPTSICQPSKIPRLNSTTGLNDCSNDALSATTSQISRSLLVDTPNVRAYIPLKKYIKNKASIDDFSVNSDSNMTPNSAFLPSYEKKSPEKATSLLKDDPMESSDSSSDDGIEEAIQRYQMEKLEQQNRGDSFMSHEFTDDSDSSSDDGIEEAIRSYQLEQHKKSTIRPLSEWQNIGSRKKMKKKKNRPVKEFKSVLPPLNDPFLPKSSHQDGKGTRTYPTKEKPPPPKANTTAELMCAEAILDISKTVMSEAFLHSVDQRSTTFPESTLPSLYLENCPADESDGNSIDSEDGIEQEIREFLEKKAQMQQRPDGSSSINERHQLHGATKQDTNQKKCQRLSLTQKRRCKQENGSIDSVSGSSKDLEERFSKQLKEHKNESSTLIFTPNIGRQTLACLDVEKSGDKSSSLDSDEDLDTAIKDLLKTKKKSKKNVRDLKQKSRKGVKDDIPNAPKNNKLKVDTLSHHGTLKKFTMGKNNLNEKPMLSKKSVTGSSPQKDAKLRENKRTKLTGSTFLCNTASTQKDDSSSVDSDDSIEQEIQRFLAQKAGNSSTTEGGKFVSSAMFGIPSQGKCIKEENQLAEIPINSIDALSCPSTLGCSESKPLQIMLTIPPSQRLLPLDSTGQSSPAHSSSLLEPADGLGTAISEQSEQSTLIGDSKEIPKVPTPSTDKSQTIKWRQSFGLPITDINSSSRTSFHITSPNKISGTTSTTPSHERAVGSKHSPLPPAWASVKTSRSPFGISTMKTQTIPSRSPFFNLLSAANQHHCPTHSPTLTPLHRPQISETESMVHIPKDKSVYVELEKDRTNHVQVRSGEEGKVEVSLKEEHIEENIIKKELEEEESFLDGDSDNSRKPEKQQGYSTLCLSSSIDPGFTVRPYIAFTSEERSRKFAWMQRTVKGTQLRSILKTPQQNRIPPNVKRRLKFISVSRRTDHQ